MGQETRELKTTQLAHGLCMPLLLGHNPALKIATLRRVYVFPIISITPGVEIRGDWGELP